MLTVIALVNVSRSAATLHFWISCLSVFKENIDEHHLDIQWSVIETNSKATEGIPSVKAHIFFRGFDLC